MMTTSHGDFSKNPPRTLWLTEAKADRHMQLLTEFWFRDPDNRLWTTPVHYKIDGASIPKPLWSLVGSPYTGDYRRASIVHDKACDDAAGDQAARRAADRMFYHACREGGCSVVEATLLYIGVRIGALTPLVPAWQEASKTEEPRANRSPGDDRLEADFRLAVEKVLAQGETDDPHEVERRTDEALTLVSGIDLHRK
jgi:hypothetical protein